MNQLGYTWYPQDWWTSETFKRLKRFPMVRYALRELFDLMYKEGTPVEMNRDYLFDDFNISLTDLEYQKILKFITVTEDGKWWIDSIDKWTTKGFNPLRNTNPVEWKRISLFVFKRDKYTCSYCGKVGSILEVDHIIPLKRGGGDDVDNLTTSCRRCNRQKKDKLVEEFLNWRECRD